MLQGANVCSTANKSHSYVLFVPAALSSSRVVILWGRIFYPRSFVCLEPETRDCSESIVLQEPLVSLYFTESAK